MIQENDADSTANNLQQICIEKHVANASMSIFWDNHFLQTLLKFSNLPQ